VEINNLTTSGGVERPSSTAALHILTTVGLTQELVAGPSNENSPPVSPFDTSPVPITKKRVTIRGRKATGAKVITASP
jgi:hypothetical protein